MLKGVKQFPLQKTGSLDEIILHEGFIHRVKHMWQNTRNLTTLEYLSPKSILLALSFDVPEGDIAQMSVYMTKREQEIERVKIKTACCLY